VTNRLLRVGGNNLKSLVIGATGKIGGAVSEALGGRHEVVRASRSRSALSVDLAEPDSIRALYAEVGRVDAVVCAAGRGAFGPLLALTDAELAFSLSNKLMGQVNLVRFGVEAVANGGSSTLTSGRLSRHPVPGGAAISMANAALEGFVRAAALELPRGIRINVVAPGPVREPVPAEVAQTYLDAVEGIVTGQVLDR